MWRKMTYLRDWSLVPLRALVLAAVAGLFLMSCDQSNGVNNKAKAVKQTDIIAGDGEKTFPEKYHLKITLPMPEAEFLALLGRLKLHYGVCGERGAVEALPSLRQHSTIDVSRLQKCYEIDGDRDLVRRVGEAWRAFTDRNHQIIYIENTFAYTGP
jgi:hypothetical protein